MRTLLAFRLCVGRYVAYGFSFAFHVALSFLCVAPGLCFVARAKPRAALALGTDVLKWVWVGTLVGVVYPVADPSAYANAAVYVGAILLRILVSLLCIPLALCFCNCVRSDGSLQ